MKKIKIGMVGADTFEHGILLTSHFKNAELFSVFDTNKFRLRQTISSAIEKGLYIKSYNNCDDFYCARPDIVLIGSGMSDYIYIKNSFLINGFCDRQSAMEGIAAAKGGGLYFFENGQWTEADFSEITADDYLTYIKSGKNPLFAFFMLKCKNII